MPATSANALAAHKDAFLSILPPFFVLGWRPIDRCKYIARHVSRRKRYSITAEAAFHPLSFVGIIQTRHQTPPGDMTPLNERRLLHPTILLPRINSSKSIGPFPHIGRTSCRQQVFESC